MITSVLLRRLYKTVFPSGVEGNSTPATSPGPSRTPSQPDSNEVASAIKSSQTENVVVLILVCTRAKGTMVLERDFHSEHIGCTYGNLFSTQMGLSRRRLCVQLHSDMVYSPSYPLFFLRKFKAWSASSDPSMIELWPSKL
ncbi:Mitochondrial outer membrane protein iml2 [Marasmius sp. AFHP31]|nr:Mitochondrial outer membrane protein iml2 [Marasmius sp. AFHP31]